MKYEYQSNPPETFAFEETVVTRQFGNPDITHTISYEDRVEATESRINQDGIVTIDTGDKSSPHSIGSLRVNNMDLPVVARLRFDESDAKDFVVVDLRNFNMETTNASYLVGPYRYEHTTSLRGGRKYIDKYVADFGLVDLSKVTKSTLSPYSNEKPITAISMNPDEPSYIVDRSGYGGRHVTAQSPISYDKTAVRVCSDGDGRLLIGNSKATKTDPQVTVHTERPALAGYEPSFLEFKVPTQPNYSGNLFGNGSDDVFDILLGAMGQRSSKAGDGHQNPRGRSTADENQRGSEDMNTQSGFPDVDADVARMRGEGLEDRVIKKRLSRVYHPDVSDDPLAKEKFQHLDARLK